MNRVELIGGVVRDPELQELESGFAFVRFSLAVNGTRYSSTARSQVVHTDYISCHIWGDASTRFLADVIKGDEVYVMGKLDQKEITHKDGTKESKTRVAVFTFDIIRKARRADEGEGF